MCRLMVQEAELGWRAIFKVRRDGDGAAETAQMGRLEIANTALRHRAQQNPQQLMHDRAATIVVMV
jgi:hypothetical protein